MKYKFDQMIDRTGTYCTQWDYIEDRFGEPDLLPFSISDTDFQCPDEIIQTLEKRMKHGIFGYTRWNHAEFKDSIIGWFRKRFSCEIKEDWIVYSPSVIYSISKVIEYLTNEGDHIVIQTPAYDAFFKVIQDNNRLISDNQLLYENGKYRIDFDDLEQKLSHKRAKVMLLCSPHNPTGRVWTKHELETIIDLCNKHNVFIISDEIHMDIVHEPNSHIPIINTSINLEKVCICTSASKTFNTPGLGGSYMILPNEKMNNEFLLSIKNRDGLSSASIFGTLATIKAYNTCGDWVDELVEYIHDNIKTVEDFINKNLPKLKFTMPESTYLAWIDISGLPFSTEQLQHALVHHAKVAIMPGETYGLAGKDFIRMNIGCPKSKIIEGLNRLKNAIDYLERNQ
ncbi:MULTISPECIES: MalY/PatB family protein [unclassified Bacillus (in: firmicutes)]|uniref:MalY/PatB family protein n=1 Tax=unclassified Bacillus (in: firmicutes) TaxID=185979 RepID=UPI000BEF6F02|nr:MULTISPECIES: MalY/PatB family protein [unclassified Bacillus (in: firmicutes)]PEJ57711.1 beta-cystathionase [Bacillus sp. AFS002410]PEL12322.1 beta-cystathionase [Bacillus sp. AFS017336]